MELRVLAEERLPGVAAICGADLPALTLVVAGSASSLGSTRVVAVCVSLADLTVAPVQQRLTVVPLRNRLACCHAACCVS
jgi:hypothetical protein